MREYNDAVIEFIMSVNTGGAILVMMCDHYHKGDEIKYRKRFTVYLKEDQLNDLRNHIRLPGGES